MERKKLLIQALVKFVSGAVLVGLLLFLPAGTFRYPNAWLLMAILFIPMFCVGVILLFKSPELLQKRLNSKESESTQTALLICSSVIFILGFICAGLSFRFNWLPLPLWVVIAASVVLLLAYGLWAEVMRENAYLSRTVEIQEDQQVVSTGLYGVVRHPMYMAAILLFCSIPLVLGSLISFFLFLGFIPVMVGRIKNEEKVLENGLAGYKEYEQKVRYRLIPFIW